MRTTFKRSFIKDVRSVDKTLQNRLQEIIEVVEASDSLHDVRNVKKMSGGGPY